MAVVDAEDAYGLAADRAGIALPHLQRAILRKRQPIAAGALSVAVVRLQRPTHATPIVLQKPRALATHTFAGMLVFVGKWSVQSSLRPVSARAHRPGGLRKTQVSNMGHQFDTPRPDGRGAGNNPVR